MSVIGLILWIHSIPSGQEHKKHKRHKTFCAACASCVRSLLHQDGQAILARVEDKAAGLRFRIETADSTTYGYICDAFVFEQYRGQGIFRQLNAEAERHLKQFPEVKRIRLNALANNEAALRAYRSAGYSDYEILLEKRTQ